MMPWQLSVAEMSRAIAERRLSPVDLLEAHLERIEAVEPRVRAWVTIDREGARRAARERDAEARANRLRGPLHGIPVGVKDIYHVAGLVTTGGAGPFAHERAQRDAAAVARLREAGAVILGKTTTTEFAFLDPTETGNPWNLAHTPGGSSSGSAAAVAARMVPLALGSQTVGSTVRPAGYCGIFGFKPTVGRISCAGMLPLAWSFDSVGIFARCPEDIRLALDVLAGYDREDLASVDAPVAAGRWATTAPRLGLPRRFMATAREDTVAHLEQVVGVLRRAGADVRDVELPASQAGLHEAGLLAVGVEAATFHRERFAKHAAEYQEKVRGLLSTGMACPAPDYVTAIRHCRAFGRDLVASVLSEVDALIMPVASGPAPRGLTSTGDPTFCAPWSFAGVPAMAVPSGRAADGLPLAVQLVGGPWGEDGLLAAAEWVDRAIGFDETPSL